MVQKEVLELKRRFKKDRATFPRVCGVYVDSNKQKQAAMNKQFLNLDDEVMHKYLEIANKTLSGKVGDALLNVNVHGGSKEQEDMTKLLMGIKDSHLEDDGLLNAFYDRVIETYDSAEPYYIILFYDAYDVMTKTSDNEKLDESEIVYEYILCSICPVKLSKPGLSYYEKEDEVDLRERDWVVQMPDAGFLYPSFTDCCPDVNECLFYNRKPKEAAHDFMNDLLCCNTDLTASEKKNIFGQILESVAEKESDMEEKIYHMHEELQAIADKKENDDNADDPVTSEDIKEAAKEAGFDDVNADLMARRYESDLSKTNATAENLVDRKLLDRNDALKQIESLKDQLKTLMAENKRLKEKLGE